jgi:iron complex outermembrane recepter protein
MTRFSDVTPAFRIASRMHAQPTGADATRDITSRNKFMSQLKSLPLAAAVSAALAAAFIAAPARAQEQTAATDQGEAPIQEVVVTGSRIVVPNMVATSPTQVVTAEDIRTAGKVDITDIVAQMPQIIDAGLGQDFGNRTSGLSTPGGVATADLRGLGPNRTLVLVDGIRLGIGDPNTFIQQPAPDLDQIPAFLLERVDVVTGGASATYGSDAIAGVVNFIMKKNFEGLQVDGQAGVNYHDNNKSYLDPLLTAFGVTPLTGSQWDGQNRQFDVIFGSNFADGKGNVTAYASYFDTDPVTGTQRDWDQCQFNPVADADGNTVGRICGGSSNSNYFAVKGIDDPNGNPYPVGTGVGSVFSVHGTSFVPQSQSTTPPKAFNSQPDIYLTRGDTRYAAGFLAHMEVTDWAQPYAQFYYTDDRTHTAVAPGAIFNNTNLFDVTGNGYSFTNCSNPLLSTQQALALCTPGAIAADAVTPGSQVVPIDLRRRNVEGGQRNSFYDHASYRAVLGSKGEFLDAWNYDAYGQFYYVTFYQSNSGYLNLDSVNNALLVTGTAANPVCISGGACVPYNIWRDGGVTPDQLSYLYLTGTSQGSYTMRTLHADVSGDLGKYGIKLPTAHDGVAVNLGVEHRGEQQVYAPDSAELGGLMLGAGSAAIALNASDHVTEYFAEVRAPLLQDMPFAKELVVDAGIRKSNYSITGGVETHKFEVQYAPTDDIRFRAGFQKAIRAPNLIELFNPQLVGLTTYGFSDPCATQAVAPTAALLARCLNTVPAAERAAFTSAFNAGAIPDLVLQQGYQLTGGNEQLKAETSKSYNVGFTFTPQFVQGLTGSIDYFHIKLNDEIAPGLAIQDIMTTCLNSGDPKVCGLIVRNFSNFGLNGPVQTTGGYVSQTNINIANALVSGLDVQLNYKRPLPLNLGSVALQMFGTYMMHNSSQFPGQGNKDCAGLYGPNCLTVNPRWRHNMRISWNMPWDVTLAATWRYLGRVGYDGNDSTFGGGAPGTLMLVNGTIPGYGYLDLAATYNVNKNVELRFGANNVLDKDPPLAFGGAGAGYNSYTAYDFLGRQLFAAFTVKF